ncbi:ABC transporter permease [Flavitalea sp. BT771]|uniref:ABC transporter permease n=1 Tax=Flavitalea sp. BT771 TaxID=3063329 RepID=UPI0026E19109|nr:ABC transporter permease [Flavitalea sp. BT771]MDO6433163.1 ABC transporter permease [Flavitalea sp. BT771]MDV6221561.1 ABC transporter permease [Flavitalea sp. BT771]
MLKNYLKVACRNLLRNKTFSFINMVGLAIGLSSFLLIALYVMDELSFDRYYDQAGNIYRIELDTRWGGLDLRMAQIGDPIGPQLKHDYSQVEEYTRIFYSRNDPGLANKLIGKGNEYITEANTAYVDSTFFNVFTFPALEGDPRTALNEPGTMVITASTATRYFGSASAVGKTLAVKENGRDVPYKVNAVIKDIPGNTHFNFNILFSMKSLPYHWGQVGNSNFYTYLVLRPGPDAKRFEKELNGYILKYYTPVLKDFNMSSMEEFEKAGNSIHFKLTPVTSIHLYSDRQAGEEMSPSGSIQYVAIFSAVALLILLIACINFMNLTTARSAGRAREVGIRKVLGTRRKELILQFLTESTLMVLSSLVIAIAIAYLILPLFNSVANKSMNIQRLFSPVILPLMLALPFAVGLLAGSYPAFFLSGFRPIEVLKGKWNMGTKSGGLRSTLVVFQFTTSIMLIIGTIVVYRQLHFIQTRDLGFSKEQVLVINDADALGNNAGPFKKQVMQLSGVRGGALSAYLPVANSSRNAYNVFKDPVATADNSFNAQFWGIDDGYLETMGIKLLKGRNFSPAFRMDSSAWIINEAAARTLGYEDPVGKNIYTIDNGKATAHPIVGLVKNFNYESLHSPVGPLIFALQRSTGLASFKVNTANVSPLIDQVKSVWKTMAPGMPFSYRFLDESFNEMYRAEQRVGEIAMIFSVLAILISCLGIFGLATFIAEQRTKEIGIRKVLGASVQGIVKLLSLDFMKLVAIAFVIAAPFGWWVMHKWLQGFVDRAGFSWWTFVVAGLGALLIALATVSFQSVRTALMNPTKSLKAE